MAISKETLESLSMPEVADSRIGTLQFTDGAPSGDATQKLYDHLDYIHALNVFLNAFAGARPQRSTKASSMLVPRTTPSSSSRS
jgi:hypothetical protein